MVRLQAEPIDVARLLGQVAATDADGALSLFVGRVRNREAGRAVLRLEYDAYREMAEAEMARLEREAAERFGTSAIVIVHRTGTLAPGEPSVAIAVTAAHRAQAMEACRFLIDTLKRRVPIWKKEHFEDGAVWR